MSERTDLTETADGAGTEQPATEHAATTQAAPEHAATTQAATEHAATAQAAPEQAAGDAPAPPSDYRLAVPDGWQRIVLDPARWGRRIDSLVAESFRGVDNQPQIRRQMAEQLKERAAAAHRNGGVELYLSLARVGGVPLSAGLVVTVIAPEPGQVLPGLDRIGIARGAEGADVAMVDLPAGPALRHRYRELPDSGDPTGNTLPVTHLDFEIAIPNSPLHLLLSFSTSMEPLAGALTELFDVIATTLQWRV
jgi:hypothetical protein